MIRQRYDAAAMNLLMPEISAKVAPGKHAVLLMDQAGRHLSDKLRVPRNITVLPLPPKCPEPNQAYEPLGVHARQPALHRVFTCYDNIGDHCCDAWNKLTDQPWRSMSLGLIPTGQKSDAWKGLLFREKEAKSF